MTMTLIETVTLTSAASSIEFTSIPTDGVDLLCVFQTRSSSTADSTRIRFNGDTGSNYSYLYLRGTGSAASSSSFGPVTAYGPAFQPTTSNTANTFSSVSAYISNYTSTANKSISSDAVTENNATAAVASIHAGTWSSSSAITSLLIYPTSDSFAAGSTASLYKIS